MRKIVTLIFNLMLAAAAIGSLYYAGTTVYDKTRTMSAGTARLSSLDKTLIGLYLDLIRSSDLRRSVNNDPTPKTFVVRPGDTVTQVSQNLQNQGLVRDAELFRLYVRYSALDQNIQTGTFQLRANMDIPQLARSLQRGAAQETQITIPEGKRIEEIADLLKDQLGSNYSPDEFLRLARRANFSYAFLRDLPNGASLEGYLFPDTYRLPENPSAQDVILRMLDNYGSKIAPLIEQNKPKNLSTRQVLTLASIVEREAVVASERPTISSVYLNRMKIGMALQADPTTQYALGYDPKQKTWWRILTLDDLKYSDPAGYNTYVNPDLPPGPIANPGLASIQAVLQPAQTRFLFFVASCNKDGSHKFAATFEEQRRNLCP
ncbi:MAG: endolytic transglycosylase MltG [Anaerolineae bacterium]|nr:endolytic transglycosylase MltG [Anaerolineae bacterium]